MILVLTMILRVVVVLFIVRLALRLAVQLFAAPKRRTAAEAGAVDLVRDRICNTFLPRSRAVVAMVAGHEEHFCSPRCAQRALAEP